MKLVVLSALLLSFSAHAEMPASAEAETALEEFNPYAPDAEAQLEAFDAAIEAETGESPFLEPSLVRTASACYRESCRVWIDVDRATQTARLYLDGRLVNQWLVSTGLPSSPTPKFDTHPNGRIYKKYSSNKFPGGDYKGLGNMPYAVFIRGGFALHGTPQGNWSKLGRKASHGCIRMHPDNGAYFNQLVRSVGISQTWITVR
jgi:hypothetical protein